MDRYLQAILTILSLVNPLICATLFSQIVGGQPARRLIAAATRAALSIALILGLAAVGGAQLLQAFGISLDVFQAAGGMVLAWMGFLMLRGTQSPTTTDSKEHANTSLAPLILFAASPGTITGVITLAVSHSSNWLPVTTLTAVVVVIAITWLVMIVSARSLKQTKQGLMHDITSRFMGLIVLAMGVQFSLSGLKTFFAA